MYPVGKPHTVQDLLDAINEMVERETCAVKKDSPIKVSGVPGNGQLTWVFPDNTNGVLYFEFD